MQILIIANNVKQAEFLQKGFKYENLSCDVMSTFNRDLIKSYTIFYDGILILYDGNFDFYDLIGELRSSLKNQPTFLLANRLNPELVEIKKSNLIDMLFIRPFSFRTISSEIRFAVFRKLEDESKSKLVLRDLELDLSKHTVRLKNDEILLRNKEFALLHFLMMNQGKVLTRSIILENVWDRNASIVTNTVDVHISLLRKKLEKKAQQQYIYTIPCAGYLFS